MSFKNELGEILNSSIFGDKISNGDVINIFNNLKNHDNLDYLFLKLDLNNSNYVSPDNFIKLIQNMLDKTYNKTLITEYTKRFINLLISRLNNPYHGTRFNSSYSKYLTKYVSE